MRKRTIIITLAVIIMWMACTQTSQQTNARKVQLYQIAHVELAYAAAKQLKLQVTQNASPANLQAAFKNARLAYKRAEFLAEYYTPFTAKAINGPPIPSMDDNDQHRIDQPSGFQVIEPYLFPAFDTAHKTELLKQIDILMANINRLKLMSAEQELADAQVFDALRLETFRIITQGITGFDAPIAQNSMAEAAAAISAINDVTGIYAESIRGANKKSYEILTALLHNNINYLLAHRDFNSFNRMEYIQTCANPLSRALLNVAQKLGVARFNELRALKADAPDLFAPNIFDANYYTADYQAHSNPNKVKLGKRLFYDPVLSGTGIRSCGSCHQPAKALTDGLVKSESIDGKRLIRRNTPTLLNAALQPFLFYDNRVAYLEDQATAVINNKDEMHGSLPHAIGRLKTDSSYVALFKQAFPKAANAVTEYNLRNALGSYIRSLVSLNAPFDRYMRGDKSRLSAAQVNGFNVFMGKAKCATCHFTPLFNGTVPPDFRTIETEVIGVPAVAGKKGIDNDKGKYELRKLDLYKYAFRTPTVRNIALTAPYMHNGAFKTLQQVVDFYNDGGGLGAGADLPNLTLPFDKLNLTDKEKRDIVAFLQSLTDVSVLKE